MYLPHYLSRRFLNEGAILCLEYNQTKMVLRAPSACLLRHEPPDLFDSRIVLYCQLLLDAQASLQLFATYQYQEGPQQ